MSLSVNVKSPAKVNLFLEVVGKRPDGYHDLETVFQEIDLSDEVIVHSAQKGIKISTHSEDIPVDETNLAYRAAALFFEKTGISSGVHIEIVKRIPVAAGLGGGSSNAAATLKALEELFKMKLELQTYFQMARSLGADVPFFLKGRCAVGKGIGDELESLASKKMNLVLVNPQFKVSTVEVYRSLSLNLTRSRAEINVIIKALQEGDLRKISSSLFNRLEDVVFSKFPQLLAIKKALKDFGALGALLSGSGPTLYAICETPEHALDVKNKLMSASMGNCWIDLCQSVC